MTTRTIKGVQASNDRFGAKPPTDPTKKSEVSAPKEKMISKSFSIPASVLEALEEEARKQAYETKSKISVSSLVTKFCREGLEK